MNKFIGAVISFVLVLLVTLSVPSVSAKETQLGYIRATITYVEQCINGDGLNFCKVVVEKDGVEVPAVIEGEMKEGDSVYKGCRRKLGDQICAPHWRRDIPEEYFTGGEV